jgi:hypothetical protein
MFRSITMPVPTLSENKYRGMHKFVKAKKTKAQRDTVRLLIRQLRVLPRVVDGKPNRFEVKLVRISAGELDDDNVRGALKAVRDEVAAWIGLDDRDPLIAFTYGQEKVERGTAGVRVEIRDQEQGAEQIVHLGLATSAGAKAKAAKAQATKGGGKRTKKTAPSPRAALALPPPLPPTTIAAPEQKQRALAFVRSAAILPWEQRNADELELTELPAFENVDPAPARAHVRAPGGARVVITRRGRFDVEGFGTTWLFAPESDAFDPATWGLRRTDGP